MAAPVTRVQNGMKQGFWTPPQWSKPPKVLITTTTTNGPQIAAPIAGANNSPIAAQIVSGIVAYMFDAVLDLEHEQTLTKTVHPVQTNAAVNTHAYLNPAQLVLYVLMSDVSGSYAGGVSQSTSPYIQAWTGNPSKSVSAYLQMINLQSARALLTVTTRLRTYSNMLITKVSPREDYKSINAARFRVEFEQVILVTTQAAPVSARPNDTATTGLGAVNPSPPSNTVSNQFGVPAASTTNKLSPLPPLPTPVPTAVNIPGAGTFTSTPQQFGAGFGGASGGGGASGPF